MRKRGLPCPKLVRWITESSVSNIAVRLVDAIICSAMLLLALEYNALDEIDLVWRQKRRQPIARTVYMS